MYPDYNMYNFYGVNDFNYRGDYINANQPSSLIHMISINFKKIYRD